MNPHASYGLWVILMCQCMYVSCSKYTALVGDVHARMCCPGYMGNLCLPLNFAVNLNLLWNDSCRNNFGKNTNRHSLHTSLSLTNFRQATSCLRAPDPLPRWPPQPTRCSWPESPSLPLLGAFPLQDLGLQVLSLPLWDVHVLNSFFKALPVL